MFSDLSPGLSHAQHCSLSSRITEKGRAQILTCDSPSSAHLAQLPHGGQQIPLEKTLYFTSFVYPGAVPASGEQEE